MFAAKIKALAAVGYSANEHGFVRTKIVARILLRQLVVHVAVDGNEGEYGGCEVADHAAVLVGDVEGHGEGLQVDFRRHDGRFETEKNAAVETVRCLREDEEVPIACVAQRRAD